MFSTIATYTESWLQIKDKRSFFALKMCFFQLFLSFTFRYWFQGDVEGYIYFLSKFNTFLTFERQWTTLNVCGKGEEKNEMMHVIFQPSSYTHRPPPHQYSTSKFFHYVEFHRFYSNIYLFTVHELGAHRTQSERGMAGWRKVTWCYLHTWI